MILIPCLLGFLFVKKKDLELNHRDKSEKDLEDYSTYSYWQLLRVLYKSKV
jgi:hypothetical protein